MGGADEVAIPASHQDQVVVQPPNTEVVACSLFTPFAGLAWSDRPAISFQFHPEFAPAFAQALIEMRYDVVPDPEAAIRSLDAANDNERVASWIRRFLEA
jgi:GMP synthase-like glutamine amidotransferase